MKVKVRETLADKRRIEQEIKGRGLIFRRLFYKVVSGQESRILQRIPAITKPTLSNVMDREHEDRTVALAMRPFYIATMTDSAAEIFKEFPEPKPELEFEKAVDPMDALDAEIFKYANRYSIAMAKYVNKTTAKKIKKLIREGLKERLHYREIVKKVKIEVFRDLKQGVRARRLAHTEAHGMVENGRQQGARANKVVKTKTWSAAADARDTHAEANRQTVLKNDSFVVGGYRLMYPGDTSLGAGLEEIINCRCSSLFSSRIDKKKLTTSKELLARYREKLEMPEIKAPGPITPSQINAEKRKFDEIFDIWDDIEDAGDTKARIQRTLAERLKDNKAFNDYVNGLNVPGGMYFDRNNAIGDLIQQWAGTSGDANARAIAMQMAAEQEFGLKNVLTTHWVDAKSVRQAKHLLSTQGAGYRAFLRAQYNLTQEFLKKKGIKTVTAYRGMAFSEAKYGLKYDGALVKGKTMQLQPLSSFSTRIDTASSFTVAKKYRVVSRVDIPAEQILGTCQTGYGCKIEAEIVALGGNFGTDVISSTAATMPGDPTRYEFVKKLIKLFGGTI